ncbi:MAG: TonB-dependent receptor [Acidobacteriota bacterium]|nr:TonB-dependent receptor [Acidobacteriota bacterium]
MRNSLTSSTRTILAALLLAVFSITASAQFKASIQGTVTDATGAVVSGAKITIVNKETARELTTTSNESGFYRVAGLPPGSYKVSAERDGFKRRELENVVIGAETAQGVELVLEAGQISETVTVTGESSPRLQTENANIDRGITTQEIRRLPQYGRDPYELLRLAPGIFGQGARSGGGGAVNLPNTTGPGGSNTSIFQVENVVPISANGQRVSANNFSIDGVSVNSLGWGGAAIVTPNQESVKEIRVTSTSYSAEDGRNSGAQVKVISQNGTNEYHGSALFKYNEPGLNSFNKWGGIGGSPTVDAPPVRVENKFRQFGGSIGGPVIIPRFGEGGKAYFSGKNKLFFFFSFEGLRERTNNTFNSYIETEQFQQTIRTQRPNSTTAKILAAAGAPRVVQLLTSDCSVFGGAATARCRAVSGGLDIGSLGTAQGQYVPSQIGGGFDGVPDIVFAQLRAPNRTRGDQYNLRFDYNLNERHNFAVSFYRTKRNDFLSDTGGRTRQSGDLRFAPLTGSAMVTWNYTISPRVLNEARGNFTRFFSDQVKDSGDVNFGIPRVEVEDFPFDRIRFGAPRGETTPAVFAQNTFDFRDTLSIAWGNLAAKYGVEIRREHNNNNLVGGARPLYSFQGLWNLANDAPIFEAINADPRTGQPANAQRYFRQGDYAVFGQHDWKARQNLTLNLGVRYEYFTPLREARGQMSNLFPGPNGFIDSQLKIVDQLYNPDRNNFAPRIGLAWSPKLFKDKLVWRGGGGIAYNRVPSVLFGNTRGNPPFMARFSICCGNATNPFVGGQIRYVLGADNSLTSYPVNPLLSLGIDPATGGITGRTVEIYGSPQDQPNAYVYNFSLEGQYELPWDLTATLGYSGSAGHKLIRIVNQNFIFTRNPRFAPVFFLQPDVNSNFHALNSRLSKRFTKGFQFDANYRWSKSIDTLSFEGPGAVTNQTNPSNLASERGPSDFDATHYFNFSGLWDLPIFRDQKSVVGKILGGWQLSSIVTRNTGFPWTPKIFQNLRQPSGETFGPTRPTVYRCCAGNDSSDDAFRRVGVNFPGGGANFFNQTVVTDSTGAATLALNPPGIGRNSFRGPQYFSVDMAAGKQFGFPRLGEATKLDLRFNFFNAFNMLNLAAIGFSDTGVNVINPNLGRSSRGLAGRVIEFQARLSF